MLLTALVTTVKLGALIQGKFVIPLIVTSTLKVKSDYHFSLRTHFRKVSDSATAWTIVCQAPLTMEFARQEYLR